MLTKFCRVASPFFATAVFLMQFNITAVANAATTGSVVSPISSATTQTNKVMVIADTSDDSADATDDGGDHSADTADDGGDHSADTADDGGDDSAVDDSGGDDGGGDE